MRLRTSKTYRLKNFGAAVKSNDKQNIGIQLINDNKTNLSSVVCIENKNYFLKILYTAIMMVLIIRMGLARQLQCKCLWGITIIIPIGV